MMIGEVHKVYPPEGTKTMIAQGHRITSDGTPLTITKELLVLNKVHFVRIEDNTTDQPVTPPQPQPAPAPAPVPIPEPEPTPVPMPQPADPLQIDTPVEAPTSVAEPSVAEIAEKLRASKLEHIQRMDTDELRTYVESIGQDSHGKRRGSLLSLARSHVENLPADQLR